MSSSETELWLELEGELKVGVFIGTALVRVHVARGVETDELRSVVVKLDVDWWVFKETSVYMHPYIRVHEPSRRTGGRWHMHDRVTCKFQLQLLSRIRPRAHSDVTRSRVLVRSDVTTDLKCTT